MNEVSETLSEREKDYGNYEDLSAMVESIVAAYTIGRNYWQMPAYQRVALYMDAMKTARILNGDFRKIDSWHDKAGYAELVVKQLQKENEYDK